MSEPNSTAAAPAANQTPALDTFVDPAQLTADIDVDMANLDLMLARQPALFVHYSQLAHGARRQVDRVKAKLEIVEAKLYASWREQLHKEYEDAIAAEDGKSSKLKPPTEPQIKAAVVSDPRYQAVTRLVIDAQHIHKLAESAVNGFDQRKDTLLQIARNAAKQMEAGQLRVVANQRNQDARAALMDSVKRNTEGAATSTQET